MPTGVLVTRDGDGHTSYLLPGTSQTRDAIDQYLLTGDTPAPRNHLPELTARTSRPNQPTL